MALETAWDVSIYYLSLPIGALPAHRFSSYTTLHNNFKTLPLRAPGQLGQNLKHMHEVYMDDFVTLAIAESQEELNLT
jgi:hypothetical protein